MSILKNPVKIMTILYVADQKRSRDFYRNILGIEPSLDVPGMTEFPLTDNASLGLMPENGIAFILGDKVPHPATGNGIPRCELYLYVNDPSACLENLDRAGGKSISVAAKRGWGDTVSYGSDPDGHIIAFAVLIS
jgi:catechol 2,3-dioxygenase-like lactoylglutathione lyase family enzyme